MPLSGASLSPTVCLEKNPTYFSRPAPQLISHFLWSSSYTLNASQESKMLNGRHSRNSQLIVSNLPRSLDIVYLLAAAVLWGGCYYCFLQRGNSNQRKVKQNVSDHMWLVIDEPISWTSSWASMLSFYSLFLKRHNLKENSGCRIVESFYHYKFPECILIIFTLNPNEVVSYSSSPNE